MDITADVSSYLLDEIEEKIHRWLIEITYWYGWERGFNAYEKERGKSQPLEKGFFLMGWEAQPKDFEFRWYISYCHFYLNLKDCRNNSLSSFIMGGKPLDNIVAIHKNDAEKIKAHNGEKLAKRLEDLIKKFFPGIHQGNGLRICPSQFHHGPHLSVCKWIGGTWLCESCIDQLGLSEDQDYIILPLKKHQNEMKRLTPERKLVALQRDQFTCQKCGVSPVNTRDIQLRVRHIIPVTEGGKTTPDNLKTVCSECE